MKSAVQHGLQGHGLNSERARLRMVDALRAQGVRDDGVLAAMEQVPRHAFVDAGLAHRAYDDVSLPIGQEQTISKPSTVAKMIELIAARVPRERRAAAKVLEVGTGCGYQAVVLSRVFGEVVSIERVRWLHEAARTNLRPLRLPNVRLVFGDGADGVAVAAPFDGIVMAAAAHRIPDNLLLQMKIGSRLVAPVVSDDGRQQSLHVVDRAGHNDWNLTVLDAVRFVPLRAGTR